MGVWWVAPQITGLTVEGQQHPASIRCSHEDRVTFADEVLGELEFTDP